MLVNRYGLINKSQELIVMKFRPLPKNNAATNQARDHRGQGHEQHQCSQSVTNFYSPKTVQRCLFSRDRSQDELSKVRSASRTPSSHVTLFTCTPV